MWYEESDKKEVLDFKKPIVAKVGPEEHQLLVPVRVHGTYDIVGYDWFRVEAGTWSSCMTWRTVEEALEGREGHQIYNVKLKAKRINE